MKNALRILLISIFIFDINSSNGQLRIIKKTLKNNSRDIFEAARNNDCNALEAFISEGVSLNSKNREALTPLMIAAYSYQSIAVDFLLKKGASVNEVDKEGRTALMYAMEGSNDSAAELLLFNGADVNQVDKNGCTALMHVMKKGGIGVAELLLKKGANVNQVDKNGSSALIHGARRSDRDFVSLLLDWGAIDVKNDNGDKALDIARLNNKDFVAEVLTNRKKLLSAIRKEEINKLEKYLEAIEINNYEFSLILRLISRKLQFGEFQEVHKKLFKIIVTKIVQYYKYFYETEAYLSDDLSEIVISNISLELKGFLNLEFEYDGQLYRISNLISKMLVRVYSK